MKKFPLLFGLLFLSLFAAAQNSNYRVVFDLTSRDTNDHRTIIRMIRTVMNVQPAAEVELVLYGKSMEMITKDRSIVAADIAELSRNKNIQFKVCAIAMKNNQVEPSQVLPGVQIIPDGIYEIITKQRSGWGYIKVATK